MKNLSQSLFILFVTASILIYSLCYLHVAPHIAIMACIFVLMIFGTCKKMSWDSMENAMANGISQALKPIFILSLIGILIGLWMMSGTIPTILYYGIKYMSPKWFYVNCVIICMLASTFNGSSVATVSTMGVALIGIAKGFGLPLHIVAGAIICGASFGDKCSPLSETTNLAPGIVGIPLYDHVKHLIWTTIPAMCITLAIFMYLGYTNDIILDISKVENISTALSENFNISIFTLIPPLLVLIFATLKTPALPTFISGILTGLLTILLVQKNYDIAEWAKVMYSGFSLKDNTNLLISQIVNRGGLNSMMGAISLIAVALAFGGLLQEMCIIDSIIEPLSKNLKSKGASILAASFSAILINFLSGEMFLSIILPGKAFKDIFLKNKIPLKYLSRTLEDCGTLVNPMVPWGVCGAFYYAALGVSVVEYIPYTFFLFLSPLLTIIFGFSKQQRFKLNAKI